MFPGTRVALHKLPAGSPEAARCGSDFPGLILRTPGGLVSGVPEQQGGGHICQGDCVAPRDLKRSGSLTRECALQEACLPSPRGEERQWELPGNSLDSTLGPPRIAITHTTSSCGL